MPFLRARLALSVAAFGLLVPATASAQRTVFLNLEQQAINTNSGNDPSLNSYASNSFMPGTVDGYPALDDAQRAELLYWFKHGTAPFDIHFTLERPAVGNYDMLVFGSEADNGELFPDLGCSASIGLADCTDTDVENISFMFWGCMPDNQQMDLKRVAFFGLTALGFGWGLEPVGVSGQIMGTYSQAGVEFGDSCVALDNAANCTHIGCADGQQNSTADLTPIVGARVDDGPPVVTIDAPGDLSIVDTNVQVIASVDDQFGDVEVVLEIVEAGQALEDHVPPHDWGLTNIPDGTWTLRVSATDIDGNLTTAEVVVCVGVDPCTGVADDAGSSSGSADETTSGGGSSGDDDGEDTTTGTSAGDESSGGASTAVSGSASGGGVSGTGFGNENADTGCGCTQRSTNADAIVCGLVVLACGVRRRVSRRR